MRTQALLYAAFLSVATMFLTVAAWGQTRATTIIPATRLSTPSGAAVSPFPTQSSIAIPTQQVAATPAASSSVSPSGDTGEEAAESLLFAELQKLNFDRRPSVILRTWADLEVASTPTTPPTPTAEEAPVENPATPSPAPSDSSEITIPPSDAPPRPLSAAEVAKQAAEKQARLAKQAQAEALKFQQWVTVGKWEEAAGILRKLKLENQRALYQKMLQQFVQVRKELQDLALIDEATGGRMNNQAYFEKNRFTVSDLEGLLAMSPASLQRSELAILGQIASGILESGVSADSLNARIEVLVEKTPDNQRIERPAADEEDTAAEAQQPSDAKPIQAWLTRRQAAWLLLYCGQLEAAESFLPTVQSCQENGDAEGLNLIVRLTLSKPLDDAPDRLQQAWKVLQIVMAADKVPASEKNEALLRAVSLVPDLQPEVGEAWLKDLYTNNESKSREILAVMGERVSRGMQNLSHDPKARGNALKMMNVATVTLLETRPELSESWSDLINLLATAWLREAKFSQDFDTSTSLGPQLQRDSYGNFYYYNDPYLMQRQRMSSNQPQPVPVDQILETMPESEWFTAIDDSLKPEISMICANLLLKVNEDERAFPYIRSLAATHKDKAQQLAEQFLRVWTQNHDMNSSRGNNRYSPYYYAYGFNQSAESIPLTRSKQERNLKDLTRWVAELRALPDIEVDQELLANAFTTCHSAAEVYRFEEIETVFGPMQQIEPDVLAALCERMRTNLSGQWQVPDLQKQNNTRRTKKDIVEQVLRGYVLAKTTLDQAIAKHPENWRLQLQQACLLFDENEYRSVLQNRNEYSQQKLASFAAFEKAAELYRQTVPELPATKYSVDVFEKWFYAMLGATDLARVDAESQADTRQSEKILSSIEAMKGDLAEEHLKRFANVVVTRVGMANPGVKFTFLTEGFKITGDRPEVTQAKRLHEYYRDLVTELELQAVLDGNDQLAANQPFGVFIRINHTPEIERESGGFSRFLQNQSALGYAYNYGRPPADYRDRFEEAARKSLEEHFEVISVTFQSESVRSQPLDNQPDHPGWKTTPYAYLLLQPRSAAVDRLPALKMDLDFLDTTGYIVLPIHTAELPLAVAESPTAARPYQNLKVTQTLDQREGKDGKLSMEIKASAIGLVPSLEQIMQLDPAEFEVVELEDSQPKVTAFDKDSDEMQIVSERVWDIKLRGKSDLASKPDQFEFAEPLEDIQFDEWSRLGFVDEDIVELEPVVKLEGDYGEAATPWTSIVTFVSATLLGVVALSLLVVSTSRSQVSTQGDLDLDHQDPFVLLAALGNRLESGQLSKQQEAQLREEIHELEQMYFAHQSVSVTETAANGYGDRLSKVARKWL